MCPLKNMIATALLSSMLSLEYNCLLVEIKKLYSYMCCPAFHIQSMLPLQIVQL